MTGAVDLAPARCEGGCGLTLSIVPMWYDPALHEATCAGCRTAPPLPLPGDWPPPGPSL